MTTVRFRKKPVVIEAVQFVGAGGEAKECPLWWSEAAHRGDIRADRCQPELLVIKTLEGEMRASAGDWIIRGVKGELYPCKPDIFAMTYEPVEVDTAAPPDEARGFDAWFATLPRGVQQERFAHSLAMREAYDAALSRAPEEVTDEMVVLMLNKVSPLWDCGNEKQQSGAKLTMRNALEKLFALKSKSAHPPARGE